MEEKEDAALAFDYAFLQKLIVGIGEVAAISGVPARQLRYWEDKGVIQSETDGAGKNRRYNYANIKKILLIKELLDEGYSLDGAVKKVEDRMRRIEAFLARVKQTGEDEQPEDPPT